MTFLESQIYTIVKDSPTRLTSRQVKERMSTSDEQTIRTVLVRLTRKGVLHRTWVANEGHYLYDSDKIE